MSPSVVLAIVAGVLCLVAFGILKAVQAESQRREERDQALRALGFWPAEAPDPGLVPRLVALHRRSRRQNLRVENLRERRGADGTLYLFDLRDRSGKNSRVRHGTLAVLSARLRLPRFSLSPRIDREGRLAAVANLLLEKLTRGSGERVAFPGHAELERRYSVRGPDPEAIRRFFTDDRLRWLAERPHWMVEAEGDLFTFARFRLESRGRAGEDLDLPDRIEKALELLRHLSG